MQSLEVSGAVRPIYGSLGVKRLTTVPPRSPLVKNSVYKNILLQYQSDTQLQVNKFFTDRFAQSQEN